MKKLLLVMSLLLLTLTGCKEDIHVYGGGDSGFIVLCEHQQNYHKYIFIRDTYTDNIFIEMSSDTKYGNTFLPYYNAKGEIMKYQEFVEVHKH